MMLSLPGGTVFIENLQQAQISYCSWHKRVLSMFFQIDLVDACTSAFTFRYVN